MDEDILEEAIDYESSESVDHDASYSQIISSQVENFTPVCNKISSYLSEFGYSTVQLISSDVDAETNSIKLFVIESWADTILAAVQELGERLNSQKLAVKNASMSKRVGEVSKDTLQTKIQELKSKLAEAEKREKIYESRIAVLESAKNEKSKASSGEEQSAKRTIKNLELQLQEHERRSRQKEIELNRLKTKMQSFIEREKETAAKNRKIFNQFKQGDISFSSADKSPTSTPAHKSSSRNTSSSSSANHNQHHHSGRKDVNSSMSSEISANSVVEALEEQRSELMIRNKELELQVRDLSNALKDLQNAKKAGRNASAPSGLDTSSLSEGVDDTAAAAGGPSGDDREELTPVARRMYDKIVEQAKEIERLQQKLEVTRSLQQESDGLIVHLRAKAGEAREQLENLRLELESRPSMKQWSQMQREYQEMEEKLQDLTVMRGDSAEIAMWRKHLSTADRIKIDKRNHELGLWLLDSLPKTVMKETLASICRELDVSDISDIVGCIGKLKAVVKTVPRMERFITQACSYVFQRESTLDQKIAYRNQQARGYPSSAAAAAAAAQAERSKEAQCMEDIFPMLKRWWNIVVKSFDYEEFNDRVLEELHRREYMIGNMTTDVPVNRRNVNTEAAVRDLKEQWLSVGRLQWAQRDPVKTVQIVRDLVDFQVEVMNNKQSLLHADEFVKERPDMIVNRIVGHIQYIFEVKTLDGVLPRMNQVYLFTEEMRNFLATVRAILANEESGGTNYTAAVANSVLLAEVERRLTIFGSLQKNRML